MEFIDTSPLSYNGQDINQPLQELSHYCPRLRRVEVGVSGALTVLTTDTIASLCRNCPLLEHLTLSASEEGLLRLATSCPRLRGLVVDAGSSVSDAFLLALAAHSRQLQSLEVGKEVSTAALTEGALMELVRRCRKLATLRLHWPGKFSTEALAALSAEETRLHKFNTALVYT